MNELSLKDQIVQTIGHRFVKLAGKEAFEKELSFALQHINKNPALKKSTAQSMMQSILNVAQVGLSLNPVLKLAYLVPRSVNKDGNWITETCLEPSYQGLCKLVTDTGSAISISCHIVYEGDEFCVTLGTKTEVHHQPAYASNDIKLIYTVATLSNGSHMIEVMRKDEVDEIRERSESFKAFKAGRIRSCIWESDYSEMARKTVIRRAVKYLPKTEMWEQLAEAIQLDESDYMATDDQINYIDSLLSRAAIDPDEQAAIYRELSTMTADRAHELIEHLKNNQVEPIQAGHNYSQTDIQAKIKSEI